MYIKGRDFRWNKNATANDMLPVRSLLKYRQMDEKEKYGKWYTMLKLIGS